MESNHWRTLYERGALPSGAPGFETGAEWRTRTSVGFPAVYKTAAVAAEPTLRLNWSTCWESNPNLALTEGAFYH